MKTDNANIVSLEELFRDMEQKFDAAHPAADAQKKQDILMGAMVAHESMLEVRELRPWGQPSRCIARVPRTVGA